jgi:hypothetical protein
MAPVVRAEPNGCQALLMFDGAYSDLEEFGWLPFIRKFDGYNLTVARQFALSFDGCRAKVGDVQGFIFLFHLRLLMVFMGFELSMPHYLHRSLFKMAKRYKRSQADTSLFHLGLIKMIVVYELRLRGDCWTDFLSRNGFEELDPP